MVVEKAIHIMPTTPWSRLCLSALEGKSWDCNGYHVTYFYGWLRLASCNKAVIKFCILVMNVIDGKYVDVQFTIVIL